jgi:nicotinate-nucleotide adenylyltransferase
MPTRAGEGETVVSFWQNGYPHLSNHPEARQSMRKKICFGGSFNPIHHGHLVCARAAAEVAGAAGIVLFPAGSPPHKPGQRDLAGAEDRLEMCRRAIASAGGFEIDDRETRRAGPSYTIDTAAELKRAGWDEVTWLIGADMLNFLPSWHRVEELLKEVTFLVMARPGAELQWAALPPAFQKLRGNVVEVPQIDISATDIRKRVAAGLPIDFLAPAEVCRYIAEHRLYRENAGATHPGSV